MRLRARITKAVESSAFSEDAFSTVTDVPVDADETADGGWLEEPSLSEIRRMPLLRLKNKRKDALLDGNASGGNRTGGDENERLE